MAAACLRVSLRSSVFLSLRSTSPGFSRYIAIKTIKARVTYAGNAVGREGESGIGVLPDLEVSSDLTADAIGLKYFAAVVIHRLLRLVRQENVGPALKLG